MAEQQDLQAAAGAPASPPTGGNLASVIGVPNKTYWIDANRPRWIPDASTYNNIFVQSASIIITGQLPNQGPDLPSGSFLAQQKPTPAVYLIEKGTSGQPDVKRHITSKKVFDYCQFNWQVIQDVTQTYINGCKKGPDISYGG